MFAKAKTPNRTNESPRASSVIRHIDDLDPEETLCVPYMRVSTHEQRKKKNLRNRGDFLVKKLRRLGFDLAGKLYSETISGKFLNNRNALCAAIAKARMVKQRHPGFKVAVVTDARNRFIRAKQYNGRDENDVVNRWQLRELAKMATGVILATLLDPDASPSEVRSHETKIPDRLGEASGKKVGRPSKRNGSIKTHEPKKKTRDRNFGEVWRLHRQGISTRGIAKRLQIPESTIRGWLKRTSAA